MYKLLTGMKILDLTRLLPGGYATQLLGDLGAEVLKVEDPWQGDYMRWMEPYLPGTQESALYFGLNRNKKSLKLNLKSSEGLEVFFKLLKSYDVVLEGFRPGVMENLGLGYEVLQAANPRVILCSISGYGQDGPYRLRSGHDINYTAIAGALGLAGVPGGQPVLPAVQVADLGGGALLAVAGLLAAYIARERTGLGENVDVSMLDGVVSWMAMLYTQLAAGDPTLKRGEGRLSGGDICYRVYAAKDGRYMSLGALEPKFWQAFCQTVGREELISHQFSRDPGALAEVESIFKQRTQAEWVEFLKDKDLCCEPILEPFEAKEHPQVRHRSLFRSLSHPQAGRVEVIGNPLKFGQEEVGPDRLPPGFGEHTEEVLEEEGFSAEEVARLKERKIIE